MLIVFYKLIMCLIIVGIIFSSGVACLILGYLFIVHPVILIGIILLLLLTSGLCNLLDYYFGIRIFN